MPFTEMRKTKEEESLVESGEEPNCRQIRFGMPIRHSGIGYLNLKFRREVHTGGTNLVVINIYV